jgi:predicted acetyltransferase
VEDYVLTEASLADGADVLQMLQEIGPGENGFQNNAHALTERQFKVWLQSRIDMSNGLNLKGRWVPQTTFWLRRNGYPVGVCKLRHRLNDSLREVGGHIGFCVRPTERGKGYAKIALTKALAAAGSMGIERVLLTCDLDNVPSWRTMKSCGGRLEKTAKGHRYYWIETGEDRPRE